MFSYLKGLDCSIKISLEDEGLTVDQATKVATLAHRGGLDVTLKIGGAEAITDMRIAANLGCKGCVAPMVESSFALQKFIKAVHVNGFGFEELYINIESKQAYENIGEILDHPSSKHLNGIVLGRSDFANSYQLTKKETDSLQIYEKAVEIFTLARTKNLKTLMGGNLNSNSYLFIKELYDKKLLDYIETRNVKVKLSEFVLRNYEEILAKMIKFEIEWLKHKAQYSNFLAKTDSNRVSNLELRK